MFNFHYQNYTLSLKIFSFFCTGIDECLSSPCLNGGTCIDRLNQYACNCTVGFVGTNCQIEIGNFSFSTAFIIYNFAIWWSKSYTGWPRKNATTLIVNFKTSSIKRTQFFFLLCRKFIFQQNDTMIITQQLFSGTPWSEKFLLFQGSLGSIKEQILKTTLPR